jgi:predicted nucleic acid-binding protein
VLDTNVVLDWWVFADPGTRSLGAALESGALRWLATPALLDELDQVLSRPLAAKWEPARERALTLRCEIQCTLVHEPPAAASDLRCSDPSDQKFLDCALHGQAQWLFSRDCALLRLARRAARFGLTIAPPERWPGPVPL